MVSALVDPEDPTIRVADKRQVERFERTHKARDGPTLDDIYFDFGRSSPSTPWNWYIALLLARKYVVRGSALTKDVDVVKRAFMQRLKSLYQQYQGSLINLTPDQINAKEDKKRTISRKSRQYYVGSKYFLVLPKTYPSLIATKPARTSCSLNGR